MQTIPLKGPLETFFEPHGRLIAKAFAGPRYVRLGVPDISFAGRLVLGQQSFAGNTPEKFQCLVQGDAAPGSDVEHSPRNTWRLSRQQIGLHGVLHVGKIPRLFAISVHHRLFFVEERGCETR